MTEQRYQTRDYLDTRYRMRLRTGGFSERDPINMDDLMWGGTGVYDTVDECWVKKNERGEWVPE